MLPIFAHQLGHTMGDGTVPEVEESTASGHMFGRRARNFAPHLAVLLVVLGVTLGR